MPAIGVQLAEREDGGVWPRVGGEESSVSDDDSFAIVQALFDKCETSPHLTVPDTHLTVVAANYNVKAIFLNTMQRETTMSSPGSKDDIYVIGVYELSRVVVEG